MKILFAGTPETAVTVLSGLVKAGHEVVAVLTREDAIVGRRRELQESPVAKFSREIGITVIKTNRVDEATEQAIAATGAEIGVVVAFGSLLKQSSIDLLKFGWFNLHFSLLPKFRGAAPVQTAILSGEVATGVSVFRIDSGMDTGPILGSVETIIAPYETAGELTHRLSNLGVSLLNELLPRIYSKTAEEMTQTAQSSYAPKLSRDSAKLEIHKNAHALELLVRAMNPEPIAWLHYEGSVLRVFRARAVDGIVASTGALVSNHEPVVACGDNTGLVLLEVQPAGKRIMSGKEWLMGIRSVGTFS